MVIYGEFRRCKTVGRVTLAAFSARIPGGELAPVVITMAIDTYRIFQPFYRFPRGVTLLAVDFPMLSSQGIFGQIMRKTSLIDRSPAGCRVTFLTILVEISGVENLVTVYTLIVSHVGESQITRIFGHAIIYDGLVTFSAIDLDMLAGQLELGVIVIESRSNFPALVRMAFPAVSR